MDSQEAKTENFELPKPSGDAAPQAAESAPEQGPSGEQPHAASGAPDPALQAALPPAGSPATVQGASAPLSASAGHSAGLSAEDADLIEKTWVQKAKQIALETRGDPHNQNKEINKVKAEYIKKRYNKDIKLAGE